MTIESLPLSEIRAIDITQLIAGPTATTSSGQFGADVIEVERPGVDLARSVGGEKWGLPRRFPSSMTEWSIGIDMSSEIGESEVPRIAPRPPPALGKNNQEVLRDGGLTAYEIHELGIAGAIGAEVIAGW